MSKRNQNVVFLEKLEGALCSVGFTSLTFDHSSVCCYCHISTSSLPQLESSAELSFDDGENNKFVFYSR